MFYNLKKTISTKVFNYHAREILKSPAVKCDGGSSTVIVSQLCSRDLIMYLVAIKTFTQYVTPLKIIVIGDRLNKNDTEVLHRNLDNVEIINIRDINTEDFPSGGTWERLLAIVDFSNEHYVIQLDADTITLSKPEEVLQCISENRSFTLGTGMGQQVITFQEATNLISARNVSLHVQVVAERAMAEIDRSNNLKYIRGCSGFAGFSKNSQTREQLKSISKSFEDKLGLKKWCEWGSEQVSSNILIANSPQPLVLPIKKYYYFQPGMNFDQFHLVHFLGSNRFTGGEYARQASKQIEILNSQSTP